MNKALLVSLITTLITACSTTPTNPNAPVVLEQHKTSYSKPNQNTLRYDTFTGSQIQNLLFKQ